MFLLRLALRPWKIAPWSQISSGLVVGFLVLLSGIMLWLESGLRPVVRRLQAEQVITAYIKPDLDTSAEESVLTKAAELLDLDLSQLKPTSDGAFEKKTETGWVRLQFVHTQDFTNHLRESFPDLASQLEGLSPEEVPFIVPRTLSIQGVFAEGRDDRILDEVRKLPGVESAESSRDRYSGVVGTFRALRWLTGFVILGLLLTTFTGLVHLGRLNAHLHQDALSVFRLWGAGPTLLRAPAMLSGLSVGFLGGVLALVGWSLTGERLVEILRALSPILRDLASPPHIWVGLALWSIACAIGWLAGLFGSFGTSTSRGSA